MAGTSDTARVAWICTAALAVFVIWVATDASANAGVGFFYAVPIGLATWWFGRRAGVIALASCVGLYLLGALLQPVSHLGAVLAVRLVAFVAIILLVSFLRERLIVLEHSAEELETIRAALAPPLLPQIAGVDFGAAFVPSELGVSGDFFLVTNSADDSTVLVVGDVVGHGPKAAQLATFVRARVAALAASTSDPGELLTLTNQSVVEMGQDGAVLSAACLRYRPQVSTLAWAIAGHPRPLRLPGLDALEPAGETLLLGVDGEVILQTAEIELGEDEGVIVYTDGATDVRGAGGRMLEAEGLFAILAPLARMSAPDLVGGAETAILEWAEGPIRDDLCIVALRPSPR